MTSHFEKATKKLLLCALPISPFARLFNFLFIPRNDVSSSSNLNLSVIVRAPSADEIVSRLKLVFFSCFRARFISEAFTRQKQFSVEVERSHSVNENISPRTASWRSPPTGSSIEDKAKFSQHPHHHSNELFFASFLHMSCVETVLLFIVHH